MSVPPDLVVSPDLDPEEAAQRLLAHLRTQVDGLDEREAARRLQQVGPNEIRRETGPHWWRNLLDQFTHPLALLLWLAAGLSLATGALALAVAVVVVISAQRRVRVRPGAPGRAPPLRRFAACCLPGRACGAAEC